MNSDVHRLASAFERFWRIGERLVLLSAFIVVGGTFGYLSLHLLI